VRKSANDQVIDGVLGGLAEYLGIESVILRLLYLVLAIANPAIGVLAYIAMAVIVPGPEGTRAERPAPADGAADSARRESSAQDPDTSDTSDTSDASDTSDPADGWVASGVTGDERGGDSEAASEPVRPDRVHVIGAGLVALGLFLLLERMIPLPDLSNHAWAIAILAIGVWILVRGKRHRA
jgi:phage shock protein PspC (stress-responsive transcriptional regulator)